MKALFAAFCVLLLAGALGCTGLSDRLEEQGITPETTDRIEVRGYEQLGSPTVTITDPAVIADIWDTMAFSVPQYNWCKCGHLGMDLYAGSQRTTLGVGSTNTVYVDPDDEVRYNCDGLHKILMQALSGDYTPRSQR